MHKTVQNRRLYIHKQKLSSLVLQKPDHIYPIQQSARYSVSLFPFKAAFWLLETEIKRGFLIFPVQQCLEIDTYGNKDLKAAYSSKECAWNWPLVSIEKENQGRQKYSWIKMTFSSVSKTTPFLSFSLCSFCLSTQLSFTH